VLQINIYITDSLISFMIGILVSSLLNGQTHPFSFAPKPSVLPPHCPYIKNPGATHGLVVEYDTTVVYGIRHVMRFQSSSSEFVMTALVSYICSEQSEFVRILRRHRRTSLHFVATQN